MLSAACASGTPLKTLRDVVHRNATLPVDESEFRVLSRRVGDVVIHTATPSDDIEEASDALRTGLAYGIPALTMVLALLIWWLVGRTLRPVETIRARHGLKRR